jgi:hypothetical protein
MAAVALDDFSRLTLPKLFVCAEDDAANLAHIVTEMHDLSPEPKELILLPGTAHGTELFNTEYGGGFRDVLVNFLEGLRWLRSSLSAYTIEHLGKGDKYGASTENRETRNCRAAVRHYAGDRMCASG